MRRTAWLVVLVLGVLHGVAAAAGPELVIIDPANAILDIGPVNAGTTSAAHRVQIRNIGDASASVELGLGGGPFDIVGSGGSLAPGQTAYWDIVAVPTIGDLGPQQGLFDVTYTNSNDDDVMLTVYVECLVRRTPLDAPDAGFAPIGPGTTISRTITVTNTTTAPLTIASLTVGDPVFTVGLHGGSLPITVPPEGTFDVDIAFSSPLPSHGYDTNIDAVFADTTTAHVSEIFGSTTGMVAYFGNGFWDGVPLGETWVRYGTLVNFGDVAQTVTATTESPEFALVVGSTIPPHTSIPISATFTPAALGDRFTSFSLTFSAADPIGGAMQGDGVTALVRVTTDDATPNDGVLDFGALEAGSAPVTRQFTITNISGSALSTNRCEQFFDGDLAVTADCPDFTVLAAGASLQFGVTFTPTHAGDQFGRITFSANGMNYTLEMPVLAQVTSHGFALSAAMLDFPDTVRYPTTPAPLDITLTNSGTQPLAIPDASISGTGFVVLTSPSAGTLAPGSTATYTVGFAPTSAAAFEAMLVLGPPASPLASVPLHGTGTLRQVTASDVVDLGAIQVGHTADRLISVHNDGPVAVEISEVASSDGHFVATAGATTVLPGGDVAIAVAYTPTATGSDDATMTIRFDGDPDPQISVALRGEGTQRDGGGCSAQSRDGSGANALLVLGAGLALRTCSRRRSRSHRRSA